MATPTYVQSTHSSVETLHNGSLLKIPLPNGTQAGNCIVVWIQCDTTASGFTITDDNGTNTWAAGPTISNGQRASIHYALNVAAGTRVITATPTGSSSVGFFQGGAAEFMNVQTSGANDGTSNNAGGTSAGPNVADGTGITTVADGDLIFNYVADVTATPAGGPITSYTAGTNFTLVHTNTIDGTAIQTWVQTTHGLIKPAITVTGTTDNFITLSLALKSAASGSDLPAGVQIRRVQHHGIYANSNTVLPTLQFPSSGNLLVACWIGINAGVNCDITSITDSATNTWAASHAAITNTDVSAQWRADNATTGATLKTIVVTLTNALPAPAGNGSTLVLYDVKGAATTPLGATNTASGNQIVLNGSVVDTVQLTPQASNSVLICNTGIENHTVSGTSGVAVSDTYNIPEEDGAGSTLDEDNAFGHYYNPNTNAVTFSWTIQHDVTPAGVGHWTSIAAEYKAPAASTFTGEFDATIFRPRLRVY